MTCPSCGSQETTVVGRTQTPDGTVISYVCCDCLNEFDDVPAEAVDRQRDRDMCEEAEGKR